MSRAAMFDVSFVGFGGHGIVTDVAPVAGRAGYPIQILAKNWLGPRSREPVRTTLLTHAPGA